MVEPMNDGRLNTHLSLISTVGRTPLVELGRLAKNLPGRVLAKLEMRNPCANVKDRVGVALIDDAESRGLLKPGMTIVEATGGNTGIGLAFVCAIRGYRLILTMPEIMSLERIALLHTKTTAVEIWDDTEGAVDYFVSAIGTGGTITGMGEVLKQRKPSVRVMCVEPANAAILSG